MQTREERTVAYLPLPLLLRSFIRVRCSPPQPRRLPQRGHRCRFTLAFFSWLYRLCLRFLFDLRLLGYVEGEVQLREECAVASDVRLALLFTICKTV